jgi:signal transduction histidine kinase
MREMEPVIQNGYLIAASIRGQYMHQAHWIIERSDEHLDRSAAEAARAEQGIRELALALDPGSRGELLALERGSKALAHEFSEQIVPAVLANNLDAVRRYHIDLNRHSERLMQQADRVARGIGDNMAEMHRRTVETTRRGMAVTVLCIASVLSASVIFVLRLRRAVVKPVDDLVDAARGVAQGRFEIRVAGPEKGELGELARAFNGMAEELSAREKRLIQSERMAAIGQLATGVAHEINNPIGIIRGYLKMMSPTSPSAQLASELRILDEEAAACERLASDLLDFSRTSELHRSEVDMDRLLSETVERFLGTAEGKGRRIDVDLAPGSIQADAGRVRQVILNLLKNAIQSSLPDTVVELWGAPAGGGGYAFEVLDRGSGIAEVDLGRVFEPFFSRKSSGSGLGLAVCQGIVKAHGGTISISRRDGGGTVVRVVIPGRRTEPTSAP